jgi:high-affinity iron transporter
MHALRLHPRRLGRWALALAVLGLLVWQIVTAQGGTPDPTNPSTHLDGLSVVLNSGILVLREGLETILVLAAVTASFRGGNASYRRPVAVGGGLALLASVATWFLAIAATAAVGPGSLALQAATGLLAIAVLLVVMNWFFHRVYWTGWISHHNRRRKRLLDDAEQAGMRRTLLGLALLGFTSVYREGFEVVLFLQNLRLRYGSTRVLEGVLLGLAFVAVVGYVTFLTHRRLPYKRMLIGTGLLLWVVLLVMVGESVAEMQQAGWIGTTAMSIRLPGWMGLWLSIFPNWETVGAQLLATVLVIGAYFLAEERRVRRPLRRGQSPAVRASAPPSRREARSGALAARVSARPTPPVATR